MSVSGVSPRPYAGSFSSGVTSRRRAASPALGSPSSGYNSALLDQCSIRGSEPHQQFIFQASKLKEKKYREALQAKVEIVSSQYHGTLDYLVR